MSHKKEDTSQPPRISIDQTKDEELIKDLIEVIKFTDDQFRRVLYTIEDPDENITTEMWTKMFLGNLNESRYRIMKSR